MPPPPVKVPSAPKETNIQVSVRCRPRNTAENEANSASCIDCVPKEGKVVCNIKTAAKTDSKTFGFDNVFGPESTQLEVYETVVRPILEEVLTGFNCTVFAYGQTGTGKTHTMEGYTKPNADYQSYTEDPDAGIIPRTMHHLFERLSQGESECSVRVSFLEIYNEDIFDLLSPLEDLSKLRLFEDVKAKGSVVIESLEEITVASKEEVYKILQRGSEKRRTGETKMNKSSSRSHSVFMVTVHQKENSPSGEELLKTGKLYLVDLAGSENIGRSGAVKDRAREAGQINQSLLTLGRVIQKLVQHEGHIPYRESKLTRLLQDSLGGKTKTSIIATVSPATINLEETLSTLDYAFHAKNIKNRPEVNQKLTKKELIKEYTEEIERLKRDLSATREKNGVYMSFENHQEMVTKIETQEAQIEETIAKMSAYKEEIEKVSGLFETTSQKLVETESVLQQTSESLQKTETKLQETEGTLKKTEVERDETKFLVKEHADVETKLHRQASDLLSVADTATGHVGGLFEKIARKSAVETHNISTSKELQTELSTRFISMKSLITDFTDDQSGSLQAFSTNATDFLACRVADLKTVANQMKSLSEESTSLASIAKSESASVKATIDDFATNETRIQTANTEACTSANSAFAEQSLKESVARLEAAVGAISASMAGFGAFVAAFVEEREKQTGAFVAAHKAEVEGLTCVIDSFATSNVAELEGRKAELEQVKEEASAKSQSDMNALLSQINSMMTNFVVAQKAGLTAAIAPVTAEIERSVEKTLAFKSDASSRASSVSAAVDNFSGIECTSRDAFIHSSSKTVESLIGQCGEVKEQIGEQQVAVVAHLQENSASAEKNLGDFEGRLGGLSASAAEFEVVSARKIEAIAETVRNGDENIARETSTLVSSIEAESSVWVKEVQSCIDASRNHSEQFADAVAGCESEVESFVSKKIRADVPTGHTPMRQAYSYPKQLIRTRPHDILLQEFHQVATQPAAQAAEELAEAVGEAEEEAEVTFKVPMPVAEKIPAPVATVEKAVVEKEVCGKENGTSSIPQVKSKLPSLRSRSNLSTINS